MDIIQASFLDGKLCPKCSTIKPRTEFHKDASSADGYFCYCKRCRLRIDPAIYDEAISKRTQGLCYCWMCEQWLPTVEFYPKSSKSDKRGLQSECKACHSKQNRKWYEANRERVQASAAHYRAQNPEHVREVIALWEANNRERVRASKDKHRALKIGAEGSYTAQEWQDLKARYDYRCLRCFRSEPEISLSVDHIVPLSKGGTNYIHNIQPICRSCNSRKRARHCCYRPDKLLPPPAR